MNPAQSSSLPQCVFVMVFQHFVNAVKDSMERRCSSAQVVKIHSARSTLCRVCACARARVCVRVRNIKGDILYHQV